MKKLLLLLVVAAMATSANAAFYLAGEFNGWNPGTDAMTDNLDGTHSLTISGLTADQRQEFKVTDGSWGWTSTSANSWYVADGEEITVTFTPAPATDGWLSTENRIGLSAAPETWTMAGDFNGWNNTDSATAMTPLGDGIYMLSMTMAPGTYYGKPVVTGTWDSISWDGRTTNTANLEVTTTVDNDIVNFYVDAFNGTVKTEVVPEPATMALLCLGSLIAIRRKK